MYNSNIPSQAELPSSAQLLRSTAIATSTAAFLLVTAVLPAEYGIDPTGVGRLLGLTEMGEIKASLAKEAEEDARGRQTEVPAAPTPQQRSDLASPWARLAGMIIPSAAAATPPQAGEQIAQTAKSDQTSVTLAPGQGAEVKLEMRKGAKATYEWKVEGGAVNCDTHGEPHNAPDNTHSYKKGRQLASDEGVLEAAFDGHHGWFWRNRGNADVTVRLKTSGDYVVLKHMK